MKPHPSLSDSLSRRAFLTQGGAAGALALGLLRPPSSVLAADSAAPAPAGVWPSAIITKCHITTVWSDGRHNAFPGIARVGDYYYVTFRNADAHLAPTPDRQGSAKVFVVRAKADNLKQWDKVAEFMVPRDIRDPLVFNNRGKVQVVYHSKEDFYSQSADGLTWSAPRDLDTEIVQPAPGDKLVLTSTRRWLFRIRRGPDGAFYSLARCGLKEKGKPGKFGLILYRSEDGVKFKAMHGYGDGPVAAMGPGRGTGHEADVAWTPDGTLVSAIRDSRRDGLIVIGRAPLGPWRSFGSGSLAAGGPALHRTRQGGMLFAARHVSQPGYNVCRVVTVTPNGVENPFIIPSGGDCAYQSFEDGPGESVLLAYYSSHEHANRNGANIYLAHLSLRHADAKPA